MEQKLGDSSPGERSRRCPPGNFGDPRKVLNECASGVFTDRTRVVPIRKARNRIGELRKSQRIGCGCAGRGRAVRLKKPGRTFDQIQRSVGCQHKQLGEKIILAACTLDSRDTA